MSTELQVQEELRGEIAELKLENAILKKTNAALVRLINGSKSERHTSTEKKEEQGRLFSDDSEAQDEPVIEKKKKPKKKKPGNKRTRIQSAPARSMDMTHPKYWNTSSTISTRTRSIASTNSSPITTLSSIAKSRILRCSRSS